MKFVEMSKKSIIIRYSIVVVLLIVMIVHYFISEYGILLNSYLSYRWITYKPAQAKIRAIEEEFGFILPPDWNITNFYIQSGRGLYVGVAIEGKMNELEDIHSYLPYETPDEIKVNLINMRGMPTSFEAYEIVELSEGRISFYRDLRHGTDENHYRVRIGKHGLKNKWLHGNWYYILVDWFYAVGNWMVG
jgi:hypothetical protein